MMLLRAGCALALATVGCAQRTFSGYTTSAIGATGAVDPAPYYALGTNLLLLKDQVEPATGAPDWAEATIIYEREVSPGLSLKSLGERHKALSPEFANFTLYHAGNDAYGDSFVTGALDDAVPTRRPLSVPGATLMAQLPDVVAEDDAACAARDAATCTLSENVVAACVAIGVAGTAAGDDCTADATCTWEATGATCGATAAASACTAEAANGQAACEAVASCVHDDGCLRGGPDGLATKSRQEMTMKGLALQKFLMVSLCSFLLCLLAQAGQGGPESDSWRRLRVHRLRSTICTQRTTPARTRPSRRHPSPTSTSRGSSSPANRPTRPAPRRAPSRSGRSAARSLIPARPLTRARASALSTRRFSLRSSPRRSPPATATAPPS